MKRILIVIFIIAIVSVAAFLYWRSQQRAPVATEIVALQSAQGSEGFARVTEPRVMQFPQDHGPHLDYQTEWWYYTGNLMTADGRRLGYQLTFFRRGITPGVVNVRNSDWATNQIYFAHFAITDAKNDSHNATEIFERGAAGLAGASGAPFRVWIDNWAAEGVNRQASNVKLTADDGKMSLNLELDAAKPPVVHGENGVSQKTDAAGNASYYVSMTRMPTQGTVRVNGETLAVTGDSWFDHEWGTTSLGANAAGWDWFSIQLDDQREVMFFQIRNKDGSIEPYSSGTLIEPDSSTKFLKRDDVKITPLEFWTSNFSQGKYPSKWRVEIPSANLDLTLTPLIADQEMRVSFTYWEGAVNVEGTSNGKDVRGQGYVEMTGYGNARGDVGY
ncbi:carotenoid 1,2-hydratase [Anaerolineae bacterium CFX7]|nr:carotenoid 1,2-hydratase [Anaerolineae bacterium CFX7]